MARQIEDARTPNTSGTTLLLGAGMVVAALGHGAIIASLVGAALVSWWALPIHLLCVWFTGNMAGNKGRNRNIGHALGMWLGVLGPLVALALDSTKDDFDQQGSRRRACSWPPSWASSRCRVATSCSSR